MEKSTENLNQKSISKSQIYESPELNLKKEKTINLNNNKESNINTSFLSNNPNAEDKNQAFIFNANINPRNNNEGKYTRGSKRFGSIKLKSNNPPIAGNFNNFNNNTKSPSQLLFMKSQINDISQVKGTASQYQTNLNLTQINEKTGVYNINNLENGNDRGNNVYYNKVKEY